MLKDILQEVATLEGLDLENTDERNLILSRVNRAAREIHRKYRFEEIVDELVFDTNQDSMQVALPFFVEHVLQMRYEIGRTKIDQEAQSNNYSHDYPIDPWPLKWRKQGFSTLKQEITNESILTVRMDLRQSVDVKVTILGTTDTGSRVRDIIIIPAGDNTKTGLIPFKEPIFSITKDIETSCDVHIQDAENNVLATIPNWSNFVNYRIFQILSTDRDSITALQDAVEVRFKFRFMPVSNDYDLFFGTDKYDDVIIYTYFQMYAKTLPKALALRAKAAEIMLDSIRNDNAETKLRIVHKAPVYFNLPYDRCNRSVDGYRER